ncbi:MAG: FKBP-type peptidyl-prolyl cis-trans isomerase [Motiliproteus sp.]
MKRKLLVSALACTLVAAPMTMAAELDTLEKKASYLMGLDVGSRMQALGYTLDVEALRLGMEQSAIQTGRALSDDDLRAAVAEIQQRFQQRQQEAQLEQASANKKLGEDFLAANASKEGIATTTSGLQYEIITEGAGPKPKETDTVQVHYRGTLIDGTEFDSSYSHGGPATFPLNGVIPGWTEGLQLISQGTKAKLYIPSELAYGPSGMGPTIGPNSALVFEVELLAINPAQATAEAKPETEANAAK